MTSLQEKLLTINVKRKPKRLKNEKSRDNRNDGHMTHTKTKTKNTSQHREQK